MPTTVDEIKLDLAEHGIDLVPVQLGSSIGVYGSFKLFDKNDRELTRFSVEIVIPETFPEVLPIVFETAGRIPRQANSHVNPNGSCCLGVPARLRMRLGKRFKISTFIRGPMKHFFLGQFLVENGEDWPVGEAEHGDLGVLRFWQAFFETADPSKVLALLEFAATHRKPRKNARCPCGARARVRRCHRKKITEAQRLLSAAFLSEEVRAVARATAIKS